MNVNDICTVISSVGFPIVACIAMGWYVNTTMKEFIKTIQENTIALKELQNHLGHNEKEVL